jgi:hypothetical protein
VKCSGYGVALTVECSSTLRKEGIMQKEIKLETTGAEDDLWYKLSITQPIEEHSYERMAWIIGVASGDVSLPGEDKGQIGRADRLFLWLIGGLILLVAVIGGIALCR